MRRWHAKQLRIESREEDLDPTPPLARPLTSWIVCSQVADAGLPGVVMVRYEEAVEFVFRVRSPSISFVIQETGTGTTNEAASILLQAICLAPAKFAGRHGTVQLEQSRFVGRIYANKRAIDAVVGMSADRVWAVAQAIDRHLTTMLWVQSRKLVASRADVTLAVFEGPHDELEQEYRGRHTWE